MNKLSTYGLAAALAAALIAPASANIVQNPGFESGTADWSFGLGWSLDNTNPASGLLDASNGCNAGPAVCLVPSINGLSQTLTTTVGAQYGLSFQFADGPFAATNELDVYWGGSLVDAITGSALTVGYSTYDISNLLATATTTDLTFVAEQDSVSTDPAPIDFLDNVNVPEPASLGIFGLGLVALGAIRRRKAARA